MGKDTVVVVTRTDGRVTIHTNADIVRLYEVSAENGPDFVNCILDQVDNMVAVEPGQLARFFSVEELHK